jgi:hypothetical protein
MYKKHTVIVTLLWVLAPVAWFLMWRDKRYHSWFPHLLWINGTIFAVITFFNIPSLFSKNEYAIVIVPLAFCFAAFQIWVGLNMKKKVAEKYIIPMIIAFIIDIGLGYLYVIL